jgi:hypothetical protein
VGQPLYYKKYNKAKAASFAQRGILSKVTNMSDSEMTIRNCASGSQCKKTWEAMEILHSGIEESIAFCTDCQREVYLCRTDDILLRNIRLNRCVAIDLEDLLFNLPTSVTND